MLRGLASLLAGAALVVGGDGATPAPSADPVAAVNAPVPGDDAACAALKGTSVEGASIVEAVAVQDGALRLSGDIVVPNLPAFCRVRAVSKPTSDSEISFEVWLPQPSAWNQKFLSTGEGGFAGKILYGGAGTDGALDANLRRGYATASTDTGHDAADLHFAVGHPERGVDYLYRAKHVTTVAAKAIITAYYGRPPLRSYFSSCSNGGRQGLLEAQLYPEDFDGLIIGAPWNNQSRSLVSHLWMRQLLSVPGAALPPAKLALLHAAVLKACDDADGLIDGVINDPGRCRFDPASLACRNLDGPACLTAIQVSTLRKIYDGPRDPRDGASLFAPYALGQETGTFGQPDRVSGFPEQYVANFVYGDPSWDPATFDLKRDTPKILAAGRAGDAASTDLSAAKRRGVKIIQYHGWSDLRIQPGNSTRYYEAVAGANGGLAATRTFYRLFMVPGMGHCFGDVGASNFGGVGQQPPPARDSRHDLITALEAWVEQGVAPEEFVATKYASPDAGARSVRFQRRLCAYPAVARYRRGDPNDAASFTCKT
jgi:feruloyl esterase